LKKKEQQITNSSTLPLPGDKEKKRQKSVVYYFLWHWIPIYLSITNK